MLNNDKENNDYTIERNSEERIIYSPKDFTDLILDDKEENDIYLSNAEIGEQLGIGKEMFRKILNQQKPTKKRDCIIAIGVVLKCSSGQIDGLLERYNYMPALDENNPREKIIISLINNQAGIPEINKRLREKGYPELDIHNYRGSKKEKTNIEKSKQYKILKSTVKTNINEINCYGDQYNSLCTTYNPQNIDCYGNMLIERIKDKKLYLLKSDGEKFFSSRDYKNEILGHQYNSIEETGQLRDYFDELRYNILDEKNRLLNILKDTKNYGKRFSARFTGDSICYFIEEFDYKIPEFNEYFLLTLNKEKFTLKIFNQSVFMYYYLGKKKYKEIYKIKYPKPIWTFESIDQIEKIIKESDSNQALRFKRYRNAFLRLKPDLEELRRKIINREEFIQNLDYIYDDREEVLKYYEVGDRFKNGKDESDFILDETIITVTKEEIFRAFELGFDCVRDICIIKDKFGKIEGVL